MANSSKKRSSVAPITKEDKKLSVEHLKESIRFNQKHIRDHKKAEGIGGSKKYNEAHIKGHQKALKKDKKLLHKRIEDKKERKAKYMRKKRLSRSKAKQLLADNSAQGHPLTDKQKHYFGMIAGGKIPTKAQRASKMLLRGMKGYRR